MMFLFYKNGLYISTRVGGREEGRNSTKTIGENERVTKPEEADRDDGGRREEPPRPDGRETDVFVAFINIRYTRVCV